MMVIDERIEQLKETAALAWERAYGFEITFGAGSLQYRVQAASANAYSDALETITGKAWYYDSAYNKMRVFD